MDSAPPQAQARYRQHPATINFKGDISVTDHPPQPGSPADPPSALPADDTATAVSTTPAEPARRSRKGLVIGGSIAAGLLVLGGAGAAAYAMLGGGGEQPEEALPASTIGYVRIDLDPSAEQKINLLRLADRLPDLSEDLGIEITEDSDLKQVLAEAITTSGECEIDYEADVAPWIGERAALAAVPGDDGEPHPVGVLAVTDEDAARTAIESGLGCGETVDAAQVAFTSGYAIITDGTATAAADVVADAEESSLADDESFGADMEALGDAGLVSFWADAQSALDWSLESAGELPDDALTEEYLAELDGYTTMAGALRANADGIELEFLTAGDEELLAPYQTSGTSVAAALPETTLVAVAGSTAPDAIDDAWEQFRELYDSMSSTLGGGALMSSTGTGITSPRAGLDTDVDPMADYCRDAAESSLGITGDDLSPEDQMMMDAFMDACTGASTEEEPTTIADDPWGGTDQGGMGQGGMAPPDLDGMVALLADEYDIHLPDDLTTLAGEQVAVAVDSRGLESLDTVQTMADVSVGVRTVGDTDALQDLAGRIDSLLVEAGQDSLATSPADDGFVFATNDAYATELAGDGGLGSTDVYRSVVADDEVSSVLFVDLDQLEGVLRPALESDPTGLAYLEPLRAVGMTSSADDSYMTATLRLSFD